MNMKKMFNIRIIVGMVIFLSIASFLVVFLAVNNGENKRNVEIDSISVQTKDTRYRTIGLIANDMKDEFISDVFSVIKAYSKKNENIKIVLLDSEGKTEKQLLQLNELININIDGIIISPINDNLPETVLKRLKVKGIPIVLINNGISNEDISCIIHSDSSKIGEAQGEYMAKKLNGQGNILVFTGPENLNTTNERFIGLKNSMTKYPRLKLIKVAYGTWSKGNEADFFASIIKKYKNIHGVVEQYNDIVLQGMPSLYGRLSIKPATVGIDAVPEVLETIKGGTLDATVYIRSSDMATTAFETIMKVMKKESVQKIKNVAFDLIATENVDTYIKNNLNFKLVK